MMISNAYICFKNSIRIFQHDESGTTLVEFAVVLSIFLFLFFGLIDFGRLGFHYVTAEKAMNIAARVAAVRPPVCPGVPLFHARGSVGGIKPDFGTSCRAGANICLNVGTVTCSGVATSNTANEIWALIAGGLPNDAAINNLKFSYTYDPNLGFLGGPYVPVVTVELQNLDFKFVSPLGALAGLAGATVNPNLGANIPFPPMSVSLPAEDLALGEDG